MQSLNALVEKLSNLQILIVSLLAAFLFYGNTLGHDYALDDSIVISKNEFTKQGLKGIPEILKNDSFTGFFGKEKKLVEGGRYRPLSMVTFAIEYQLFGIKPFISHFVNILLYALVGFLIYLVILNLFSERFGEIHAKKLALLTGLLFLLHPIHTEVVANIKGRDEIMSLLFSLLAFYSALRFYHGSGKYQLLLSIVFLFLGLMSKENAIAFVIIIPLGLYFFTRKSIKQLFLISGLLIICSLSFILIRNAVLGGFHSAISSELMNNPFLGATANEKYATVIYTWLIYLKLLIFPHPLTFDYYPYHIGLVGFSNIGVLFMLFVIIFLGWVAVKGFQAKTLVSFSIIAFAASFALVSNLVINVGTFMNERFVFMPSVFWCLVIAWFALLTLAERKQTAKIITGVFFLYVLIFYPIKTIARNRAWKNDLTLFTTDVKTSFNSAKSTCSAGGKLWEKGKTVTDKKEQADLYRQSEKYLRRSLKIYPEYVDAWLLLGNVLYDSKKDIKGAVDCYLEVIKRQPGNESVWNNADIVLQQSNDRNLQLAYYKALYKFNKESYVLNYRLGVLYGRYFNDLDKSIVFLKKAVEINPDKVEAIKDLGTAYGFQGNNQAAYDYCKKALKLEKSDPQIYINLGIAASKLGFDEESKECFAKAEQLKIKKVN